MGHNIMNKTKAKSEIYFPGFGPSLERKLFSQGIEEDNFSLILFIRQMKANNNKLNQR